MRYFITLSYDGTHYHGWQVQPNGITVQSELERGLSLLLRQPIAVTGAGRTDAGVHARRMVAHFDTEAAFDPARLAAKLNSLLHHDISIWDIHQVSDALHARFSATRRTYRYFIHTEKDPFLAAYSCLLRYRLDFEAMNCAAATLLRHDDFAAFCKSHADVGTTLCKVYAAEWHQTGAHSWYFEISANRFLRNMVRAVVGTLIEVGRGRLSLEGFQDVVRSGRRTEAGESMPANALFLETVEYPAEN